MSVYTSRNRDTDAARLFARHPTRGRQTSDLPRIAVLIIGDGRDAIRRQTLDSFVWAASGYHLAEVVEVDDRDHALGFCGAIQAGWKKLRDVERWNRSCGGDGGWEYVWHLEEDWEFLRPFDMRHLARILDGPGLAQAALRRGPVNEAERKAGGVVEQWPAEYADVWQDDSPDGQVIRWLEHRLFWTTNPSLYRMDLLASYDWPDGPRCEEAFGGVLIEDGYSFAFAGERTDDPWIRHNGFRTGTGY